ncbi:MAG: type II secretion system F family protein [Magnetococcales bacterium]|nr:type II secretion system F family protein [Magnetococcales bacterium]
MPKFQYKATDQSGTIRHGTLEAANLDELELRMDRMGMMLISHKNVYDSRASFFNRSPISRQDLIIFCFDMEQMASAGVPILEGLKGLRDGLEKPQFREVVSALVEDIEAGKRLSEAMQSQPRVFNEVFTQLVHMGERSGCLDKVFLDMTENLKWEDELISQVKKVMMYPMVVGVVVTALVFFLMIFLVPKLVGFITEMGGELPMHTLALIATSDFIAEQWYILLAIPVLFFTVIKLGSRWSVGFHRAVDRIKLRLWLFGPLSRKIILVRFANAFALMYRSGISILECLKICESLADNLLLREAIQRARGMVSDGKELSSSFQEVQLFPALLLRILKVGETTGNLDTSLRSISYFYNREVKETVGKLETLISPAMTTVLGLMIGWVILSVLGPIYDLISTL